MHSPDSLDLAHAATSQLGGPLDSLAGAPQLNNASVGAYVRCPSHIFACGFSKLDSLPLPLAARFIIVPGHLQRQLQEQLLDRLQNDPGNTFGFGCQVGEINQAGNGQLRPLAPDRSHQLLGLG